MKHVSFTQIMTYVRCPEHYLFRYLLGIKRPPGKAQKHGFALHETFAYHYEQKKQDTKGITAGEAKEFFADVFKGALEDYELEMQGTKPLLTIEKKKKERQVNIGMLLDSGVWGIDVYFKQMNPRIVPDLVEAPFAIPSGIKNLELSGRMDLTDVKGVIHEMKTTRRSPSAQDILVDPQLAIYQLAYHSLKGRFPTAITKDYIVFSKKDAKIVQFKVAKPMIEKRSVLENVATIMNAVKHNIFYCIHPAESWMCSKEWCGYYKLHKELRKTGLAKFMKKHTISQT